MMVNQYDFNRLIIGSSHTCCFQREESECSEGQLSSSHDLEGEEYLQLNHFKPDATYFCLKHLQEQISLWILSEKSCADPLNKHVKLIKTNLVSVSMDTYEMYKSRIIIVPGLKLCKKCLYVSIPEWFKSNPSPIISQIASSSSSELYNSPGFVSSQYEIQKARNVIDTIARNLQISPIGDNEWNDKVSLIGIVLAYKL